LVVILFTEMALGVGIGLMVSFINEALTLGAQILSFEAGYSYASAIDPTTGADSDVFPVLAQLLAGLLFFTLGLHRFVIKAFADSLTRYPPGNFQLSRNLSQDVIRLGGDLFAVGLRLALPVIGLLMMTEIALGVMGRINSQIHMGQHATPAKMLLAMMTLATIFGITPALYQSYAGEVFSVIRRIFGQ
jgi:flagellar biosynthesis protein FliR